MYNGERCGQSESIDAMVIINTDGVLFHSTISLKMNVYKAESSLVRVRSTPTSISGAANCSIIRASTLVGASRTEKD